MPITEQQLISAIQTKNGFPFNANQSAAILHANGPLAIVAGPGTGKTEVLVVRTLKLLCCQQVQARSIFLTTFTEKAARNLEDRLIDAFLHVVRQYPTLSGIDPAELHIGTLHGLCNDILQEFRFSPYQNLRLMDEVESSLFIHRKVVPQISTADKHNLYGAFRYLLKPQFQNAAVNKLGKWQWVDMLQRLFDRVVEDLASIASMQAAGGAWQTAAAAIQTYEQELATAYACDFPRLQRFFLDFLASPQGAVFLSGDASRLLEKPPLTHVLVDEYQDTNPIQEEIYFQLCNQSPHNLTIVGDDDQALYRFRGGTVECMVGFAAQCQNRFGGAPQIVHLAENYRSDAGIVTFCNQFMQSHTVMAAPNVRIQGKPPLVSASGRAGNYPAVGLIRENRVQDCATSMATLVSNLQSHGIISDFNQCVLLLRSTKNTPNNAGKYITALNAASIPIYNPRSRAFLEQCEVVELLGAFISIVDPGMATASNLLSASIQQMVADWVTRYTTVAQQNPSLQQYVTQATNRVAQAAAGRELSHAFPTIVYRILAHEPFRTYQQNVDQDLRLSKLTRLFEAFSTQYGRRLSADGQNAGMVNGYWLGGFYYGLCGYLDREGLDDDEDEEVVCPAGFFPVMTIHQAKGLEFDFVFVGNLGGSVTPSGSHQFEADLIPHRPNTPNIVHSAADLSWHDDVRLHFVAYSRARYSLILMATTNQLRKQGHETASFGGDGGPWIRQNVPRL